MWCTVLYRFQDLCMLYMDSACHNLILWFAHLTGKTPKPSSWETVLSCRQHGVWPAWRIWGTTSPCHRIRALLPPEQSTDYSSTSKLPKPPTSRSLFAWRYWTLLCILCAGGSVFFFFLSSLDYLISWRWNPLSDWPVGMFFLLPVGLWCGEHSGNCPAGKHSCVCRIIWCVLGYQLPKRYLNFTIPITRLSNQTLYTVGKSRIFPYQCVLYPCYMINKWLGQLLIIY